MGDRKSVDASRLSSIAMVAGQEPRTPIVIDDGIKKEWVGFGWITIGPASDDDYKVYPFVTRGMGETR